MPNFDGNKIAAHDGKIGCNTVEHTTAFLYSDWLYFLRDYTHRIKLSDMAKLKLSPTAKKLKKRQVLK